MEPKLKQKSHPRAIFTPEEDDKLLKLVDMYGENNWHVIAAKFQTRNVRQCRERYQKYLSPNLDKSPWTLEEDSLLREKYSIYGPRWKTIAFFFPNRTDISIKNRMNKLARGVAKLYRKVNSKFKSSGKEKQLKNNENMSMQSNQEYDHDKINIDQMLFPEDDVDLLLDTEKTPFIL